MAGQRILLVNMLRRFALPLVLLVLLAFATSVLAALGPGPDDKLSDDIARGSVSAMPGASPR